MQAQNFMRVEEVAQELGTSKSHAYKVIHKLNAELREKGYLTISGRVNRNFFHGEVLLSTRIACLYLKHRNGPCAAAETQPKFKHLGGNEYE